MCITTISHNHTRLAHFEHLKQGLAKSQIKELEIMKSVWLRFVR
jgi:hypothetical protein